MNELHFPWLEVGIFLPAIGSLIAARANDSADARRIEPAGLGRFAYLPRWGLVRPGLLHSFEAHDRWDLFEQLFGVDLFVVDELSAPLLALVALQYFSDRSWRRCARKSNDSPSRRR